VNPMNPQNVMRHEVIGLKVRIVRTVNRQLTGLTGRVVDETRNTLTLSNGLRNVIVPKDTAMFYFYLPTGEVVEVDGKRLVARSEDRVKMQVRRW